MHNVCFGSIKQQIFINLANKLDGRTNYMVVRCSVALVRCSHPIPSVSEIMKFSIQLRLVSGLRVSDWAYFGEISSLIDSCPSDSIGNVYGK